MRGKEYKCIACNLVVKKKYNSEFIAMVGEKAVAHMKDIQKAAEKFKHL